MPDMAAARTATFAVPTANILRPVELVAELEAQRLRVTIAEAQIPCSKAARRVDISSAHAHAHAPGASGPRSPASHRVCSSAPCPCQLPGPAASAADGAGVAVYGQDGHGAVDVPVSRYPQSIQTAYHTILLMTVQVQLQQQQAQQGWRLQDPMLAEGAVRLHVIPV